MKDKKKHRKPSGCFLGKPGDWTYPIAESILASKAYAVLNTSARDVLLDWLRHYFRVSNWEKNPEKYHRYTWAICRARVAENTFHKNRSEILRVGFFDAPPEIQGNDPARAILFTPSSAWENYTMTPDETRNQQRQARYKAARIAKHKSRRRNFLEKMHP